MNRDAEAANAKASADKLQDAAHGGAPVAIPAAFDARSGPALERRESDESFDRGSRESEADRAEYEREGGGTPRQTP
jgi:hypothetical protein